MKKNKFRPNKRQVEFFKNPKRIKLITEYIEKIIKEVNEEANSIK